MKIKRFNESSEKTWDVEFSEFIDYIYQIYDEYDFVNIRFDTLDGRKNSMNITDFAKKNQNYDIFIKALGKMTVSFTLVIDLKKDDYDIFKNIIDYIKSDSIEHSGWNLSEMDIKYHKDLLNIYRAHYIIKSEFVWHDKDVLDSGWSKKFRDELKSLQGI